MSLIDQIPHLRLEAGTYEIDEPIVVQWGGAITGAGKERTIIKPSSSFVGDALIVNETPTPEQNFTRHITVEQLSLDGIDHTINGLDFDRIAEADINHVAIQKCNFGVKLRDSIVVQFNLCRMNNNRIGFSALNKITTLVVQSTRIRGSKLHNVEIDGPGTFGIQLLQAVIESSGNEVPSPGLIVGSDDGDVKGFNALGTYLEANQAGDRAQIEFGSNGGNVPQGTFVGCFVTGGSGGLANYGVRLKTCRSTTFLNCNFSAHDVATFYLEDGAGLCGFIEPVSGDPTLTDGPGRLQHAIYNGQLEIAEDIMSTGLANVAYGSSEKNTVLTAGEERMVFVDKPLGMVANPISDIAGISGVEQQASNLRGTISLTGVVTPVVFPNVEKNEFYQIYLTGDAPEMLAVQDKSATGFNIISSNPASTATVDWLLVK